jgi:Family of unknown function (DUF6326)
MEMKTKLSILWLFATLNFIYCDVVGVIDPNKLVQYLSGKAGNITLTQGFLLGAAILLEIPIAMVLLSRLLRYKANRWSNIMAGIIMSVVQIGSLFVGTPTPYYIFFSLIEICTTLFIIWMAWKWV